MNTFLIEFIKGLLIALLLGAGAGIAVFAIISLTIANAWLGGLAIVLLILSIYCFPD